MFARLKNVTYLLNRYILGNFYKLSNPNISVVLTGLWFLENIKKKADMERVDKEELDDLKAHAIEVVNNLKKYLAISGSDLMFSLYDTNYDVIKRFKELEG